MTGTEILLILAGLILGAACLGVGYLLGKKKKVIAQAKDLIGQGVGAAQGIVEKAGEKAGEIAGKI